jgi:hypothetical protein
MFESGQKQHHETAGSYKIYFISIPRQGLFILGFQQMIADLCGISAYVSHLTQI